MSLLEKYYKKFEKHYTGAVIDPLDKQDIKYDPVAAASPEVDWEKGFDVEKELNISIPIKDQGMTSSCVGQGWAYYTAVLNALELGNYTEVSAKAIYSQIFLDQGGAYIREGGRLLTNWGSLLEYIVPSYINGKPPKEDFVRQLNWKTKEMNNLAAALKSKSYAVINAASNIDIFAKAIRDNYGVVGGVLGSNNGTWNTLEPKPSEKTDWAHCLYYGKFGIDRFGKYIATPNSWGSRGKDEIHPDGWQKLREDFFDTMFQFNPWTMIDQPNIQHPDPKMENLLNEYEKKFIIEGEGKGRVGVVVNGDLLEVTKIRRPSANSYVLANNGLGVTVSTDDFNSLYHGKKF